MSANYLVSFRPLCSTAQGRDAVKHFRLPPYIDGSCRREPDFEHAFPAISCLCRTDKFVPRLETGDRVAYVTTRRAYDKGQEPCWKLVALMQVVQRFESHEEAAEWYRAERLGLPSNCMVPGNAPVPLEKTLGFSEKASCSGPGEELRAWDRFYVERARTYPAVVACRKLMFEGRVPPRIEKRDWLDWNGKVPGTQNPPEIQDALWQLLETLGRSKAA